MPSRTRLKSSLFLLLMLFIAAATGCVNIKPVSTSYLHDYIQEHDDFWQFAGEQSGVRIRCFFSLSQDSNLYFFDADLYDAGIVPVFIEIENIRLDSVRWTWPDVEIKTDQWRLEPVAEGQLREAVFKKYGIDSYTENDLEQFDNSFGELLMSEIDIGEGEKITGVIYFKGGRFHPGMMNSPMMIMGNVWIGDRKAKLVFRLNRL
ncbi:MAG: hypothetical protein JXQ27_11655 [Acidobacteria bacterium]|nr:hypothetical protein [Acidobacteriota bacterium]